VRQDPFIAASLTVLLLSVNGFGGNPSKSLNDPFTGATLI